MAGFYAVYHGPEGMKNIAKNIHTSAVTLDNAIQSLGYKQLNETYFDTLRIELPNNIKASDIQAIATKKEINLNYFTENIVSISLDETTRLEDLNDIANIFATAINKTEIKVEYLENKTTIPENLLRTDKFLQQKVFNTYHSETEMMRYIKKLERRDIALNHSMTPLGSCTMKLNPATTMLPLSWDEFGGLHPFCPSNQSEGYKELITNLTHDLSIITGFEAVSIQPNSGAAGEHTGLMTIRAYHKDNGQGHRNVAIIPASAHGTNPASAVMAGFKVLIVKTDEKGNISIDDLREKAIENKDNLAAMMITYPSTHGVFESQIREMVKIIHENGGLVYMDGANMNAQLGLTNPGFIGADVCHLNLHKTFAIPHGGGGPGVGAIGVAKHLTPFLPGHSVVKTGGNKAIKAVAAAPFGSASILPVTYGYIKMCGNQGLKKTAQMAILNANYIATKLKGYYEVLYSGETGRCAHEMVLDCRHFQAEYHVGTGDIAQRLMDYGFHAPTLSFPVHETLMVEPTESESKEELDRFIETMIQIHKELDLIKEGKYSVDDNPILNSPHTVGECVSSEWKHSYDRETAAFPLEWIRENKFWPYVGAVDNGYGDRNLVCSCKDTESYK
jgi:glycine dehydrogenase